MPKGYRFPRTRVLAGEDGFVSVWILTPTGNTSPNAIHVWMDDKIWIDDWIWTEEPAIEIFPLTRYGIAASGREYVWNDSKYWRDAYIWTETL